MSVERIISFNKKLIEERLSFLMDIDLAYSQKIVESMRYSLLAGGKRLRPCIFLEVLKMYDEDVQKYLDIACAIEMIHTYSLIHDDLPAMDNDSLRRGKPTNHIVFGENIAILAGDALLNYAYEILFKFLEKNLSLNNAKAFNLISNHCGIYGMIGGQVSDIINENMDISFENFMYIHENKTAKLIMASALSAGYISNADEKEIDLIKNYAYQIGMAFQLVDDLLDVTSTSDVLGKTVGKDEKAGKNTFLKYFDIEKANLQLDSCVEKAVCNMNSLKVMQKDVSFFIQLTDYIKNRKF